MRGVGSCVDCKYVRAGCDGWEEERVRKSMLRCIWLGYIEKRVSVNIEGLEVSRNGGEGVLERMVRRIVEEKMKR